MGTTTAHGPRMIPRGQWRLPQFAAEAYVGAAYIIDNDDGRFSANPADYWSADDRTEVGTIIRNEHPYRTVTGRLVYGERTIKHDATVGDLRRLARAAERLVR